MNHVSQADLIAGLRHLRRGICAYRSHRGDAFACDCKYGVGGGEQSGCPEVRSAAVLLAQLSPDEYARLMRRAERPPPAVRPSAPKPKPRSRR